MEVPGMQVDNSVPASPAPAAPEPIAATAPAPEPAAQPQAQTGVRDINVLNAILDGADPSTLSGGQIGQPPAAATPPLEEGEPQEPQQQPHQQQVEEGEPQEPEFQIPDKFKNPDGTPNIAAMAKSYAELEKVLGEQGNKLGQFSRIAQENQMLKTYILQAQAQQQQQQQAQQPQSPPQPEPKFPWEVEMTPEEREKFHEEFLEDPVAALTKRDQQTAQAIEYKFQKMLEQVVNPLTPIIQEHQFRQEVQNYTNRLMALAEQNPDIYEVKPTMEVIAGMLGKEALRAMEQSGQDPLQVVYEAAKKLHKPAQAAPPSPEQLLSDQNFRQQIIQNPDIKNEILKSHVQSVQQNKPPQLLGSQPGGTPAATPPIAPKNVREAGAVLRRQLGL